MRRLLVTLLVSAGIVLVGEMPAHACSCIQMTMAQHAKNADAVFTGEVTKVPDGAKAFTDVSYSIAVETVYKGTVEAETVVTSKPPGRVCGLEHILLGRRYLFFTNVAGTQVSANLCGGTTPLTAATTAKIVAILGEGHAPTSIRTTPPEPVLTRTDLAEPAELSRLAAPGGALVIVGALGLLLLRRRTSR